MKHMAMPVLLCLLGCAEQQPPCSNADAEAIAIRHEARLAIVCAGLGVDCPNRAAENARFRAELAADVRCDK